MRTTVRACAANQPMPQRLKNSTHPTGKDTLPTAAYEHAMPRCLGNEADLLQGLSPSSNHQEQMLIQAQRRPTRKLQSCFGHM